MSAKHRNFCESVLWVSLADEKALVAGTAMYEKLLGARSVEWAIQIPTENSRSKPTRASI